MEARIVDVRSPLGALLIAAMAAVALYVSPGWDAWLGSLLTPQPGVSSVASPSSTTLTIVASTPTALQPMDWQELLVFALTGRWPAEPLEASVLVDGRRLGATPLAERAVQPGLREITLSRNGFIEESLILEITADSAHRLDLVLFPVAANEARVRSLSEQFFLARVTPIYFGLLYLVVAFHIISLLNFFRGRFGARLLLALLHIPLAALMWLPLTRLAIALETPHWVAFAMASALVGLFPLALHPRPHHGFRS